MVKNIFKNIPVYLKDELIEQIINSSNCKIERIVSRLHPTPKDKWYNQEKDEFVLILKGSAGLRFEDKQIRMKEGDYIIIPKYTRHRVEKTSEETIWLAVFY